MSQSSHSAGPLSIQPPTARQYGTNHRWVVLGVGVAAQASFAMAFAGLPVTGVLMRAAYRMTTEQLGLVLGCMALGVTLSEIVWGLLTDVFGDRKVLLTGLLSTAMALLSLAFFVAPSGAQVPSYRLLGVGLVLVGMLGGSVNSSSGRAVMGWFTDGKRGLAMSIRQTAVPVGGAIGAALLPWLAHRYGFQSVFGVLAVFSVLSALLTWCWLQEHAIPAQASSYPAGPVETHSPLRRLDVWRLAVASGLLTVPQIAVLTFGGVFLHDRKAVDLATIATVIIIVQISGSIARIVMGAALRQRGQPTNPGAWHRLDGCDRDGLLGHLCRRSDPLGHPAGLSQRLVRQCMAWRGLYGNCCHGGSRSCRYRVGHHWHDDLRRGLYYASLDTHVSRDRFVADGMGAHCHRRSPCGIGLPRQKAKCLKGGGTAFGRQADMRVSLSCNTGK